MEHVLRARPVPSVLFALLIVAHLTYSVDKVVEIYSHFKHPAMSLCPNHNTIPVTKPSVYLSRFLCESVCLFVCLPVYLCVFAIALAVALALALALTLTLAPAFSTQTHTHTQAAPQEQPLG